MMSMTSPKNLTGRARDARIDKTQAAREWPASLDLFASNCFGFLENNCG
jgi:hypothetical protein